MKKAVKGFTRLLAAAVAAAVLVMGIRIFTDGMWLWGLPDSEDVQSVSILYPDVTDEAKEIRSGDEIELALKLTGFLRYDLFGRPEGGETPLMTFTYHLKDGGEKTISANGHTVWWEGKGYSIKDEEMFIHLAEGIFFLEDLQKSSWTV